MIQPQEASVRRSAFELWFIEMQKRAEAQGVYVEPLDEQEVWFYAAD